MRRRGLAMEGRIRGSPRLAGWSNRSPTRARRSYLTPRPIGSTDSRWTSTSTCRRYTRRATVSRCSSFFIGYGESGDGTAATRWPGSSPPASRGTSTRRLPMPAIRRARASALDGILSNSPGGPIGGQVLEWVQDDSRSGAGLLPTPVEVHDSSTRGASTTRRSDAVTSPGCPRRVGIWDYLEKYQATSRSRPLSLPGTAVPVAPLLFGPDGTPLRA